jgi:hypothetical protein
MLFFLHGVHTTRALRGDSVRPYDLSEICGRISTKFYMEEGKVYISGYQSNVNSTSHKTQIEVAFFFNCLQYKKDLPMTKEEK